MAAAVFGRALVRRPDAAAAAGAVWLSLDDGLRRIDRLLVYGRRMLRCEVSAFRFAKEPDASSFSPNSWSSFNTSYAYTNPTTRAR